MTWAALQGALHMQMHPDRITASHVDKSAPLTLAEVGQVGKKKSAVRGGWWWWVGVAATNLPER